MNFIETNIIFSPNRKLLQDPASYGLEFEEVRFNTSDNLVLHGWYIPGTCDITLVWFHGNAGNISDRVGNIVDLRQHMDIGIFIFDYRGYGLSEGVPSEQGTYIDGEAAMSHIASRTDIDQSKILLFGRSLGCSIAAEIAIRRKTYALVLESGFTSIQAMVSKMYSSIPGIETFARKFIKTQYNTLSKIGMISTPIMIIHGNRDEIIPHDMGLELYKAANPPKRFYSIKGAGHNDAYIVGGSDYYKAIVDFLEDPTANNERQSK